MDDSSRQYIYWVNILNYESRTHPASLALIALSQQYKAEGETNIGFQRHSVEVLIKLVTFFTSLYEAF